MSKVKKPTMASQLGEGEHNHGTSAVFIREQLDALAIDADSVSAPTTPEQWRRCLQGILRGDDWRFGTWK